MRPETLVALTVDDMVRGGACREGVEEWRDEHAPKATQISVAAALEIADEAAAEYIRVAAGISGSGDGSGDGSGYGDGDGSGDGSGSG